MQPEERKVHFHAVRQLTAATACWAVSFPIVKSINLLQAGLLPENSSWFHASLTSAMRFGASAFVLFLICLRTLPRITRLEWTQGCALGFFGAGGILLQMDGLAYTTASTSAFLTQSFCIWVPIFVAVRKRLWPDRRITIATLLMLAGVALLTNFDLRTFRMGRGELETLIAGIFFAGQILCLEEPRFRQNNVHHFSFVMFAVMMVLSLPILALTTRTPRDVLVCYSNPGVIVLCAALVVLCTLLAFVMMNKWQPFVPATEAAIIYGAEPVLTSLYVLFLPALISRWTGIDYPNETFTRSLLIGGSLIVLANLFIQGGWLARRERSHPEY